MFMNLMSQRIDEGERERVDKALFEEFSEKGISALYGRNNWAVWDTVDSELNTGRLNLGEGELGRKICQEMIRYHRKEHDEFGRGTMEGIVFDHFIESSFWKNLSGLLDLLDTAIDTLGVLTTWISVGTIHSCTASAYLRGKFIHRCTKYILPEAYAD